LPEPIALWLIVGALTRAAPPEAEVRTRAAAANPEGDVPGYVPETPPAGLPDGVAFGLETRLRYEARSLPRIDGERGDLRLELKAHYGEPFAGEFVVSTGGSNARTLALAMTLSTS